MRVTIVGTGDLGRALGHIFDELGQKDGNIEVFGTEPLPDVDVGDFLVESSIPILPFEEALSTSDLLILAIPARALTSFVMDNFSKLPEDTIVVDPTNSPKEGEDLKGVLQKLGIGYFDQWVRYRIQSFIRFSRCSISFLQRFLVWAYTYAGESLQRHRSRCSLSAKGKLQDPNYY